MLLLIWVWISNHIRSVHGVWFGKSALNPDGSPSMYAVFKMIEPWSTGVGCGVFKTHIFITDELPWVQEVSKHKEQRKTVRSPCSIHGHLRSFWIVAHPCLASPHLYNSNKKAPVGCLCDSSWTGMVLLNCCSRHGNVGAVRWCQKKQPDLVQIYSILCELEMKWTR